MKQRLTNRQAQTKSNNKRIQATFVMEQHLGHNAFYQNLRRALPAASPVDAAWVEVTYTNTGAWWEELKLLSAHVRGTLCGRQQVVTGLRRQKNDIVFFNTQAPAALAGNVVRTQPYILCTDITPIQYDGMGAHYNHRPDRHPLLKRFKHRVNCNLFQGAVRLVPWSTWVRDSLIADYGVPPERITVVPPGVDTERWRPQQQKDAQRPVQILFVGGDFERKGGDLLLQAFRALPPGVAELTVVTRTKMSPAVDVRVRNDLHPNSPELIALYQASDLFVLPTKAEAFGIAAVEAGAVGLPVIATDVGGVSDIVVHEETGLLMPPDNAQALYTHLLRLIDEPAWRKRLGNQARARTAEKFDARKNAAQILTMIEECLSETVEK